MRQANLITADLIASGLNQAQTALLMELVLSMSTGYVPAIDAGENRRAWDRKRKAMLPSNWGAMAAYVFKRDGYACTYCGDEPETLHCDHIVPLSRGGLNEFDNLTAACPPCNLDKGNKLLSEWNFAGFGHS